MGGASQEKEGEGREPWRRGGGERADGPQGWECKQPAYLLLVFHVQRVCREELPPEACLEVKKREALGSGSEKLRSGTSLAARPSL